MSEDKFEYNYKSSQRDEILEIRNKYLNAEALTINKVREIDAKVNSKATIVGISIGLLGTLLLGIGLSLVLTAENFIAGVPVGLIGIAGIIMSHPFYKKVLLKERQKHAEEIIKLTDELLGENKTEKTTDKL